MANDSIKVVGHIKVEHFRDGVLIYTCERENVVTTAGKQALASLLNSASAGNTLVTHMGFGTSSTLVQASDTALGTELTIGSGGYSRVAVTRSNPSGNTVQYVATLSNISSNPTIQEAGLFNAASGVTLIAHQLTGACAFTGTTDSLQVTWSISLP
jgi:hypothetical protein